MNRDLLRTVVTYLAFFHRRIFQQALLHFQVYRSLSVVKVLEDPRFMPKSGSELVLTVGPPHILAAPRLTTGRGRRRGIAQR